MRASARFRRVLPKMRRPADIRFLEEVADFLGDAASELSLSDLRGVLDTSHPIAQRVLSSMSHDGGQHVRRDALLAEIQELLRATERDLLRRAFELHDLDVFSIDIYTDDSWPKTVSCYSHSLAFTDIR